MRPTDRRYWTCFLALICACRALGQLPVDPAQTHPIPAFTVPPAQPGAKYERFFVFGDSGTGREFQKDVAKVMAERANQDGLQFMIMLGDNFYENGVQSVDDPLWQSGLEDVYADPALRVTIYPSLGNHDHRGNVQAQVDYSERDPNWKMVAPFYTAVYFMADGAKLQLFALDTDPIVRKLPEAERQLDWLERYLAQSDARWKIVFGHHPLYSHVTRDRESERKTMRDAIGSLLAKNKVDVYFAGHDHTLELSRPIDGVTHVISGAAAGPDPDKAYGVTWTEEAEYAATNGGFVACRLSRSELVIEFVRMDGKTQFAKTLRK